jgi:hypothetical protein
MTEQWYAQYYVREYREQIARFKLQPVQQPDYPSLFARARKHGFALAKLFEGTLRPGLSLEVGSSVGGVLKGFQDVLNCDLIGIEPSPGESDYANQQGIKTFATTMESFHETIPAAENIVCTQSLNHLLNPRFFFQWSHEHLQTGGHLILEVMNFRHAVANFAWLPRAVQVDHTYMFVPEVLASFVEAAGFDIVSTESHEHKTPEEIRKLKSLGLPPYHVIVLAQKSARTPFADRSKIKPLYPQVRESLRVIPMSRWKNFKGELRKTSKRIRRALKLRKD